MACWRLFPPEHVDVNARMWATAVPLLVTAQFAAVGLGIIDDPGERTPNSTQPRHDVVRVSQRVARKCAGFASVAGRILVRVTHCDCTSALTRRRARRSIASAPPRIGPARADTVRSMSRQNDPRELLRGPLMYGIVHVTSTILWFRESTAVSWRHGLRSAGAREHAQRAGCEGAEQQLQHDNHDRNASQCR